MKQILTSIITIAILILGTGVYASQNENKIQNQNEVKIQNQGEEIQIQTKTQEQESQGSTKSAASRSETAKENMSTVSQKVEELLTSQTEKGGIGEQIRQVAQEQKQTQDKIKIELGKVASRSGFLKLIIGPDYQALRNLQTQMDQNRLRIRQLEQLKTQLVNQDEVSLVKETIQALTEQNTALQDRIKLEEKSGSLLGWLLKLFTQ